MRDRKPGQNIPFYVNELKCLSEYCVLGLNLKNVIKKYVSREQFELG